MANATTREALGFGSLIWLLTLAAPPASAQGPDQIASVSRVAGEWMRGRWAIGAGNMISRSDTLRLQTESQVGGFITILLADDRHVRYDCNGKCTFVPADSLERGSVIASGAKAMRRLHRLFSTVEYHLVPGIMRMHRPTLEKHLAELELRRRMLHSALRTWDNVELLSESTGSEAVLMLETGAVDVSRFLAPVKGGPYLLRLSPVRWLQNGQRLPGFPHDPEHVVPIDWKPDAPAAVVRIDGLRPGLYELAITSQLLPTWALIVDDSARFASAAAEFEEARTVASNWDHADKSEIRTYLRAVLLDLAGDPETSTLPRTRP